MPYKRILPSLIAVFSLFLTIGVFAKEIYAFKPHDLLLTIDSFKTDSPVHLTKADILYDIALLKYALERAYSGWKYLPETQKRAAVKKLDSIVAKNPIDLCYAIDDALFKIRDSHLMALKPTGGACPRERNQNQRMPSVGKNIYSKKNPPWHLEYRSTGNLRVPVLSVTALPDFNHKSWTGFMSAANKLKHEKNVIIDLRGNKGGSDSSLVWLAKKLTGITPKMPYTRIKSKRPETLAALLNLERGDIFFDYILKNADVPDWLKKNEEDAYNEFQKALSGELPEEMVLAPKGGDNSKTTKDKNIFILADAECGSSCENGILHFRPYSGTRVIGENTAGRLHFGNIGIILLPKSRVSVQIASDFKRYDDGSFLELIGLTPDIKVEGGQDAIDIAIKLIADRQ